MCYSCDTSSRGLTLLQSSVAFHKLIAPAELITSYWCSGLLTSPSVFKMCPIQQLFKIYQVERWQKTRQPQSLAVLLVQEYLSPLLFSHLQMAVLCLPCDLRWYLWLAACGRPYYCKCQWKRTCISKAGKLKKGKI